MSDTKIEQADVVESILDNKTVEEFFRQYLGSDNEKRFRGYFSVNPEIGDVIMTIQLENELQDWEIVGNKILLRQRLKDYVLESLRSN